MEDDSRGSHREIDFVLDGSPKRSAKNGEVAHINRLLTLKRCCLGPISKIAIGSGEGCECAGECIGDGIGEEIVDFCEEAEVKRLRLSMKRPKLEGLKRGAMIVTDVFWKS
jgi:hypothetical protein